jgi:hypothetical protein
MAPGTGGGPAPRTEGRKQALADTAYLNMLATALLAATAMAFTRQRRFVMVCCGALFVLAAVWTTVAVWWAVSAVAAVVILMVLIGIPLLALLVFAVDYVWTPFCLEMTWPGMICWLFWPALVALNALCLALRLFPG